MIQVDQHGLYIQLIQEKSTSNWHHIVSKSILISHLPWFPFNFKQNFVQIRFVQMIQICKRKKAEKGETVKMSMKETRCMSCIWQVVEYW